MKYIAIGLGLIYVAIRYGLARPATERTPMLSGGVGIVICILMIVVGLALVVSGLVSATRCLIA